MEPPPSAEVAEAQGTGADGGGPGGEKQAGPGLRERPRRRSESLQLGEKSPTDGAGRGEGGKAHAAESRHSSVRMRPCADHDAGTCDRVLESGVHREL